jgi:hypothetical protein
MKPVGFSLTTSNNELIQCNAKRMMCSKQRVDLCLPEYMQHKNKGKRCTYEIALIIYWIFSEGFGTQSIQTGGFRLPSVTEFT